MEKMFRGGKDNNKAWRGDATIGDVSALVDKFWVQSSNRSQVLVGAMMEIAVIK